VYLIPDTKFWITLHITLIIIYWGRRGSVAARFLGLWVRISPEAWMSVSCECCVLSGRGLCVGLITRPETSYREWCVWVWSWSLDKETLAHWRLLRHEEKHIGFLDFVHYFVCQRELQVFVNWIFFRPHKKESSYTYSDRSKLRIFHSTEPTGGDASYLPFHPKTETDLVSDMSRFCRIPETKYYCARR
jgi:hypothetical protein